MLFFFIIVRQKNHFGVVFVPYIKDRDVAHSMTSIGHVEDPKNVLESEVPESISQIFEVLTKMVKVIDDYSEKTAKLSTLPELKQRFLQLFYKCPETNADHDGIQAFLQFQNYIGALKTQYDRQGGQGHWIAKSKKDRRKDLESIPQSRRKFIPNETLRQKTRAAYTVAHFLDSVCSDVLTMLRKMPPKPSHEHPPAYGTICTMILNELATYTPITFDGVEEMQTRRDAASRPLKPDGTVHDLLAKLEAVYIPI